MITKRTANTILFIFDSRFCLIKLMFITSAMIENNADS